MKINNIVFTGGDKRQYYAAKSLSKTGLNVYLSGFEKLEEKDIPNISDTNKAFELADVIVLPIAGVKGDCVKADYSDKEIKLDYGKTADKLIVAGKINPPPNTSAKLFNILKRADFAAANAVPSAEGALQVAMQNYEGTLSGAKCLVIGYGRIGKILSRLLRALNADVTVASRSSENAAFIKADGNKAIYTAKINSISNFDIVFNTADALVINDKILYNSSRLVLIIDLASVPGGVDFKSAAALGFKAIHALGLPGRFSPKAAGEIISDTILNILEEEYSWQRQT